MTPIQAIKAKCLDCCCGSRSEVVICPVKDCSLYPFRLGKNPNIAHRTMTDEQRQAAAERLARVRAAKNAEKTNE